MIFLRYSVGTMRWIKKRWQPIGIIFAITLVIVWKEKQCQAQTYQCRATYATQLESERTAVPLTVYQQASEEQAIATACEPNGYFCRLFGAANLPTILLFFIGIGGIWAALRTLKAIESQTYILSESQRPRIVADAGDDPSKTFGDQEARRVVLKVVNKGLMPATEYTYESWIEVLPDTSGDFTNAADHFKFDVTSVLYPDSPHKINIPLRSGVSETDFNEVRKLHKYVCVRLYVQYKDPFVPKRRCYANFGFYVLPGALGFLGKHNGVGYEDKKA